MLVDAMEEIKLQYQIKRNWMSDPCAPKSYTWDGLNCVYSPDHPRIISKYLKEKKNHKRFKEAEKKFICWKS